MATPLIEQLRDPSPDALRALLADDVRFHSPAADYRGSEDVAHLLGLIATVVGDLTATRQVRDGAATITFLTATVDGHALDGVLDEHHDERGRIVEATLLLRPYAGLRAAIAQMQSRLSTEPLPSTRR